MSQTSTQVVFAFSASQNQKTFNRKTMESIPQEFFEKIWEMADTGLGQNVPVSCRIVGKSFEIYSTEVKFDIAALSVHRRSRQRANTEDNVARLSRKRGHKGPHNQVKSLYFDPRRDRICPINETQWTREAVKFFYWVLKAVGVERIAVSDCSHTLGIQNDAQGPWASFYWWSNIENWSSNFTETLMYTTKIDFDVYQKMKFVGWNEAAVTQRHREKRARKGQRLKARLATRKLQVAGKKQDVADNIAKSGKLLRTKQDGVPTWLLEAERTTSTYKMEPQTIAFENMSLSDTKITKLSYLSTISNEIFETIMVEVKIEEPRNVTVRCERFGNGFELHSDMPLSNVSQIFRRWRQWAKSQHVVAYLAYRRGYSWPLESLKKTFASIQKSTQSVRLWKRSGNQRRSTHFAKIAIIDYTHAEDARRSLWGTFYTMSKIENWSSSFKDIMMYTTKRSFDEHYRPKFVSFEDSRITLNMYQSKARSIRVHHARPILKKLIVMKDAQDVADKEAERNGGGRKMVEGFPA
ncbi:hypothetical protein BOTCAL_0253g00190 [Botryotinia calthae]|uniref:Uncharacterized protein n=1 Tax=Botryotinia calthae TaxID=38488 RepID=A0A4Y8CZ54_9HELO|nr:hypothetical protein BOTCAL_0253g00190 [Botryotinia calthae]